MKERLDFLLKCKDLDIIPKFLSFKVPTNGVFDIRHVHRFQMKLLRTEIQKTRILLTDHQKKLDLCRKLVQANIPEILFPSIINSIHEEVNFESMCAKDKLKNKLIQLSQAQDKPILDVSDNINYVDVDKSVIPKFAIHTLSLGPKHPTLTTFKPMATLAEVDELLEFIDLKLYPNKECIEEEI